MSSFLKSIDRVGKEFKITIDRQESFKTTIGGLITIIYYCGLIALFFFFGKDLYLKQEPNFIQRVDVERKDVYEYFNVSNSFFAFSVFDSFNNYYNLSYFDAKLVFVNLTEPEFSNFMIMISVILLL